MKKKFDYLVFIGRFQPFHYGHAKVIETALEHANHVIVLVGSSNRARDWFNPFIYEERAQIITDWHQDECFFKNEDRLTVLPLNDHLYNMDGWLTEVQTIVSSAVGSLERGWKDYSPKIGLIGHDKDHTSFYLGLFPQWGNMNVDAFTEKKLYNSTDVRGAYFSGLKDNFGWQALLEGLPASTMKFLQEFHGGEHYQHMVEYHEYVRQYKIDHAFADPEIPYDPKHTAADACVTQSGHILLVERKDHPGKGLWAMPGGFINKGETIRDAMVRELWEETKLKLPPRQILGSVTGMDVFDDPHRSARGRIISHTYRVELEPVASGLPRVKGRSDAKKAMWVPLSELRPEKFFEDHYFIIQCMTGRTKRSY